MKAICHQAKIIYVSFLHILTITHDDLWARKIADIICSNPLEELLFTEQNQVTQPQDSIGN